MLNNIPEAIADEITDLANRISTSENEVILSAIICRNDRFNIKGQLLNDFFTLGASLCPVCAQVYTKFDFWDDLYDPQASKPTYCHFPHYGH